MRAFALSCLALLAFAAGPATAAEVYRCTDQGGGPRFQDSPCKSGESQILMHLPDDSAIPSDESATTTNDDAPPDEPAPPQAAAPARRPRGPSLFLCTRYDGSRYVSGNGVGGSTSVPYAMLDGSSGQGLAQAYGGRNGIGISAPGMRTPPTIPASHAPLANAYVQINDECHRAGPREACAYLHGELDKVEDQLKRAFSDTESQLKHQQDDLRAKLRGC